MVILSDIGSNTLLMPNDVFLQGKSFPNRLRVLRDWVREGGSLMMVGGYLSFQGIEAKANYKNSPLAESLPVLMEDGDDREETPEGAVPHLFDPFIPAPQVFLTPGRHCWGSSAWLPDRHRRCWPR